ncbi:unnamed protein product [Pleuronectes platessa]|uniref:Uncharacterized protein n=1 Tax=Pleuronectes platessa TaxID=8262 RepID=A0A9N7YXR1_PLEPL|nr:unnamed protein product [Pleuronectes platessa]
MSCTYEAEAEPCESFILFRTILTRTWAAPPELFCFKLCALRRFLFLSTLIHLRTTTDVVSCHVPRPCRPPCIVIHPQMRTGHDSRQGQYDCPQHTEQLQSNSDVMKDEMACDTEPRRQFDMNNLTEGNDEFSNQKDEGIERMDTT